MGIRCGGLKSPPPPQMSPPPGTPKEGVEGVLCVVCVLCVECELWVMGTEPWVMK